LATLISRSAAQSTEDPRVSLLLALEAYQRAPTSETEQAILNALGSSSNSNLVVGFEPLHDAPAPCRDVTYSFDGRAETAVIGGQLIFRDLVTGGQSDFGESPSPCPVWIADEASDRIAMEEAGGLRHFFGPVEGPWDEVVFDEPTFLLSRSFLPTNKLLYIIPGRSGSIVTLRDDRTGERVGTPVGDGTAGYFERSGDGTADGSLIAIGFGFPDAPEGQGRTFVIDGETGEEIYHVNTRLPAEQIEIDEDRRRLFIGMYDGSIQVADLDTGELEPDPVRTTGTAGLLALRVRADGSLLVVSESQIERVDPSTKSTETLVELRDPSQARIRSDGMVMVVASDGSIEVVDPGADALIEQSWDVDPFAHVAFEDGFAAALSLPAVVPEVVDLSTGARLTSALIMPDGTKFPAIKIYPEPDGLWAFSRDNELTRWEGEEMVETISLGGEHFFRTQLGDLIAVLSEQSDGRMVIHLVSVERGATGVVFEVEAPDTAELSPSADGGLHVIEGDGTLLTYDETGALISTIETGVERRLHRRRPGNGQGGAGGRSSQAGHRRPGNGGVRCVVRHRPDQHARLRSQRRVVGVHIVRRHRAPLGRRTRRVRRLGVERLGAGQHQLAVVVRRGNRFDVGVVVGQVPPDPARHRTMGRASLPGRRPRPHRGGVGAFRARRRGTAPGL
jgi:hypothetical protein